MEFFVQHLLLWPNLHARVHSLHTRGTEPRIG
jgi:hypothetical protein